MALQLVAETAITHIVQQALDKVLSCLYNHVELFLGAEKRLEKIRASLEGIHAFIGRAERSPVKDPKLMELLGKLKDATYDAEDLLEEYEIEKKKQSEEAESSVQVPPVTNTVRGVVRNTVILVGNRAQMAMKLPSLTERLEDIQKEAREFQLEEKVTDLEIEFKKQRDTHSFVIKSEVFGRDKEKEEIVALLLPPKLQAGDGSEDDENVSVIPIVGMGGLGKTTLAKLVFNHEGVQNYFEPKIWICVSHDFDVIGLGKKIIQCATKDKKPPISISNLEELQRQLGETLSGKRYLLILDDVWNEEPEKWYRLREMLLRGGRESRIVVTTRSEKVAKIMSNIPPHILKGLPENGCRSLFYQRAFGNPKEEAAPPNLVRVGKEIVKKCGGNPLAVTTLGGLLCSERSERKWEFVRDSEMWDLTDENDPYGILPALRLSYNHLKPHLKQCFAFCAIFPQDYKIEKELVIKLWMANGFIRENRRMELEDIGNEIFDELVMRSFFEGVNVNEKVKKPKRCHIYFPSSRTTFRMHDLMHDLAHSVMENEYRVVHNGKWTDISPRIRHVSKYGHQPLEILAASLPKAQMLRTYVMLKNFPREEDAFRFPCDIGLFRFMRALDLVTEQGGVQEQLCTSLGNLQHLRYLNLSFSLIEMLPESLTSLCYLQTLILRGCENLCELPEKMRKLTNLRCLDIDGCDKLTRMPAGMGQLSCLQELSNFIVGRTNEIACGGIGELEGLNLRGDLRIQLLQNITDATDVPQEEPELEEDKRIEAVRIEAVEEHVIESLQPHQNLERLKIYAYCGVHFPSWMMDPSFTKLVKLVLTQCWRCNCLPPLGHLPLLKVLKIHKLQNVECIGEEFYGKEASGGFPSLEMLVIWDMQKLLTWSGIGWKGKKVFPNLVNLEITECPMLTTIELFPYIKNLKSLQILYCPQLHVGLPKLTLPDSMHLGSCNLSSFTDEDQTKSPSSLQLLPTNSGDKLVSSSEGLHFPSSLEYLTIMDIKEFAYVARELSSFTNLRELRLHQCHGWTSLPEGIENLTSLEHLEFQNCPEMESLPGGLQRLSTLKSLLLFNCPTLEIRCKENTGEDWHKIQHIPRKILRI